MLGHDRFLSHQFDSFLWQRLPGSRTLLSYTLEDFYINKHINHIFNACTVSTVFEKYTIVLRVFDKWNF